MFCRIKNLDWILIIALFFLAISSLALLASYNMAFFWRQLLWYIIGFIVIIFGSQFNWRGFVFNGWAKYGLYFLSLSFLVLTNIQIFTIRGTKGWLRLGSFQFEPAELAKLALIFILAGFFSRRHIAAWQIKNILMSFVYVAIPTALVIIHPDLGSAVILLFIWFGFLIASGVNKKRLAIGICAAAIAAVCLWTFFLKPYQKDRITAFLVPDFDPLGINYNVNQSKIAIGSAGFLGKGFGSGTQVQLRFLPEAHTDFIFAAFTEEWGIAGAIFILLTFVLIIYRFIHIGMTARDNFARFVVFGGCLFFTIHFFINVGSNLGMLPVTGITFPFFSYGGSNLLTTAVIISTIEYVKLES